MKLHLALSFLTLYVLPIYSNQYYPICVYGENNLAYTKVINILEKFNIPYEHIKSNEQIKIHDSDHLYIIAGDLKNFNSTYLPKYYVLYHTNETGNSLPTLDLLSQAIAIWDISWKNINKYKQKIKNFYFLPNENYPYLDPLILPLFLPLESLDAYKEILSYSNQQDTDISSHLPTLFAFTILQNPKVIIEAGVRGGESTIALYKAAQYYKAELIGLDIDPSSRSTYSHLNNARFLCINDLDFPKHYQNNKNINIIFIDTSHLYEHTMKEITCFIPLLAEDGILMFHDSNVTPINGTEYIRINNTTGSAIGNTRGVTQALKKFFDISFDEYQYCNFSFISRDIKWQIIHYPFCNGLTVIQKTGE